MIKVIWHYATIASIEIFHNKQEIGQHKFRLIRHNEKSCFNNFSKVVSTTLCENETIKYYLISNWLNQNYAHGKSAYMSGRYRNHRSPGSRPLQKF